LLLPPEQSVPTGVAEEIDLRESYFREGQKRANLFVGLLLGWWTLVRDVICLELWSRRKQWLRLVPFRVPDFIGTTKEQWDNL
jgi:hypothetical protein